MTWYIIAPALVGFGIVAIMIALGFKFTPEFANRSRIVVFTLVVITALWVFLSHHHQ